MQSDLRHNQVKYDKKMISITLMSNFYRKYVDLGNKLKKRLNCDGICSCRKPESGTEIDKKCSQYERKRQMVPQKALKIGIFRSFEL